MRKSFLIFNYELKHAIFRPGYLVMLLIVPVVVLLGIGLTKVILDQLHPQAQMVRMGYVDQSGTLAKTMDMGMIRFLPFDSYDHAVEAVLKKEIDEFLVLPKELVVSKTVNRYIRKKEFIPPVAYEAIIKSFINIELLSSKVPPELLYFVVSPLQLNTAHLNEKGERIDQKNNPWNSIIPAIFSLLLMLAMMMGSSTLIRGLGEEKESRLIEVLLTSVSMRQLLLGKVFALGTAGLIQVVVWVLSAPLLLHIAAYTFGQNFPDIQIPTGFALLGVLYFILGYLLFAVLAVGMGAIGSDQNEGIQIAMFYMMMGFIPLWFAGFLFNYPNSPVWELLALFPITAPVQSMLMIGISELPLWLVLSNVSILLFSIVLGMLFSLKLFKTYMLMYGKRPSLKELLRALKN